MHRRDLLKTLAALALSAQARGEPRTSKQPLGLVIHSYWIRAPKPLPPEFSPVNDALAFVEHAAAIGAAGVQTRIGPTDPAALEKLRATVDKHGLYLEGTIGLPRDEAALPKFEADIQAALAAGAKVLRTVCMGGRRYETFDRAEQFPEFAERSWKSLTLVEPIVRKHRMQLAVENHKDWRIDEMCAWLKRLSSEYVGVCLDTGNSMALLEDPHAVVDAFAPWTMTTHLKDMGVAEYDKGFLLSEVPLGEGCLDLPRVVATIHKARPTVRLNLEMITRDPLDVPCLTPKYWATLGEVKASELAETLARVQKQRFPGKLPTVSTLSHVEQLKAEAANIAKSFQYAAKTWA